MIGIILSVLFLSDNEENKCLYIRLYIDKSCFKLILFAFLSGKGVPR